MNLKLFAMAVLVVVSAAAQSNSTPQYDVRNVRWDMSIAEAQQFESQLAQQGSCDSYAEQSWCHESDVISGIPTQISFHFDNNGLIGVLFLTRSKGVNADTKSALYAWYDSLVEKYGDFGVLYVGDARVGPEVTSTEFDASIAKFFRNDTEFHVQFQNGRTIINLEAIVVKGPNGASTHIADVYFFQKTPDNF